MFKFLLIPFVLLLSFSTPATAQEVEDESEFNYDMDSKQGPRHWGDIHPEWSTCRTGEMQSPIDLLNERVKVMPRLGRLKRVYKPANATLVNRGHDIELRWEDDAGYIVINGTKYYLKQCHWHSPSEHTLDGKRFHVEIHLVHQSKTNGVAVLGIMYKIGRRDSFLSMLNQHLTAIANVKEKESPVGSVNPRLIKLGSRKYYRYIGSLTIPPCTQNVIWTIVRKIRTISREQIHMLRDAVHDEYETNSRPLQQINSRTVEFYRPEKHGA